MIDIPQHILTTFQILYRLKTSQLEATLENLQERKRTNTVPTGLRIKHKNKFYMEKQLRERWDNTLSKASTALLDITIEHHEQCIQDAKNKIRHKTAQIQLKCDTTTAERIIHKIDLVHIKLTKATKRLKQQNTKSLAPTEHHLTNFSVQTLSDTKHSNKKHQHTAQQPTESSTTSNINTNRTLHSLHRGNTKQHHNTPTPPTLPVSPILAMHTEPILRIPPRSQQPFSNRNSTPITNGTLPTDNNIGPNNITNKITQHIQRQICDFLQNKIINDRTQLTKRDDKNNTTKSTDLYNKHTLIYYTNSKRNRNNNRHDNKNKLHKKIKKKTVINLSNKPLTNTTLRTLSKGLTFSPKPKPTTYNHIYSSLSNLGKT